MRVATQNLESVNVEQTYVCDPPTVENTTKGGQVEDYGPSMEANLGEEDERIIEQMEADDAEHVAFVDEFAVGGLMTRSTSLRIGSTLHLMP